MYFQPAAEEEQEVEECLLPPLVELEPAGQEQLREGEKLLKAFPASSQIGGFDVTVVMEAVCGFEICRH